MNYSLIKRERSNDYDIVDSGGLAIGQIISSDTGFSVYLLGDFERLLEPSPSALAALESFEEWAASNTLSDVLTIDPTQRGERP